MAGKPDRVSTVDRAEFCRTATGEFLLCIHGTRGEYAEIPAWPSPAAAQAEREARVVAEFDQDAAL